MKKYEKVGEQFREKYEKYENVWKHMKKYEKHDQKKTWKGMKKYEKWSPLERACARHEMNRFP